MDGEVEGVGEIEVVMKAKVSKVKGSDMIGGAARHIQPPQ